VPVTGSDGLLNRPVLNRELDPTEGRENRLGDGSNAGLCEGAVGRVRLNRRADGFGNGVDSRLLGPVVRGVDDADLVRVNVDLVARQGPVSSPRLVVAPDG